MLAVPFAAVVLAGFGVVLLSGVGVGDGEDEVIVVLGDGEDEVGALVVVPVDGELDCWWKWPFGLGVFLHPDGLDELCDGFGVVNGDAERA